MYYIRYREHLNRKGERVRTVQEIAEKTKGIPETDFMVYIRADSFLYDLVNVIKDNPEAWGI